MTWLYGTAAVVVLLDQITKLLARRLLVLGQPVRVIPGFLDLDLGFNSGGAFGRLPGWAPLFILVALVTVYAVVRLGRSGLQSKLLAIGLGGLLGGAVGNLIDRLLSPTREVTDFLSLHIAASGKTYAWPTFNVADIGIVGGALLVVYYVYVVEKRTREPDGE